MRMRSSLLWSLFSVLVLYVVYTKSQDPDDIFYYTGDSAWLRCPSGWARHGPKCLYTLSAELSWDQAQAACQSYGGQLLFVDNYNLNTYAGQQVVDSLVAISNSPERISYWIGFKCRDLVSCYSSSGFLASIYDGFWAWGQPIWITGSMEMCVEIHIHWEGDKLMLYWQLGGCTNGKAAVCELVPCVEGQVRCVDGRKCIRETSVCDGLRDCDDFSDERNCTARDSSAAQAGSCCGGDFTGDGGELASPNFPNPYLAYATCIWTIASPLGSKIQLTFTTFELEDEFDYVRVYDSNTIDTDRRIGQYYGNAMPTVPLTARNHMTVLFQSDHSTQLSGFNATWAMVDFDTCGGDLHAHSDKQWFTSPNYPDNVPGGLLCTWTISTNRVRRAALWNDNMVSVKFTDIAMEEFNHRIEIWDGKEPDYNLLGQYTGVNMPPVFIATTGGMKLLLQSGEVSSLRGFNATYWSGCDIHLNQGVMHISSPGYGRGYPDLLNCSWTLTSLDGRPITLVFTDFETEQDFDVVVVYDTSEEVEDHLVDSLSGIPNTPIKFRSETGAFIVRFTSDYNAFEKGWRAIASFDCRSLSSLPNNTHIDSSETWYGSEVTYYCDDGYKLHGTSPRYCGTNGQWTGDEEPYCVLKDCGQPPVPERSILMRVTKATFGGKATYACEYGYRIVGSETITCRLDGWETPPVCTVIICPKLSSPEHGSVTIISGDGSFNSHATYTCELDYFLNGYATVFCTGEGNWSAAQPTCQLIHCPRPDSVSNAVVAGPSPVPVHESYTITCNSGFTTLVGDVQTLTCMRYGDFNAIVVDCDDEDECVPSVDGNAEVCGENNKCHNVPGGYWCECEDGYYNPGQDKNVCEDLDECSESNGGCDQDCENTLGSYYCTCRVGYTLYPGPDDGYLVTGHSCIVAMCPSVSVENGNVFANCASNSDGEYPYATKLYVTCQVGYIPDGDAVLTCQADGSWSGTVTQCNKASCPALAAPVNGQLILSDGHAFGSVADYSCNLGYWMTTGHEQRECSFFSAVCLAGETCSDNDDDNADGSQQYKWTGKQPECENCGAPCVSDDGEVSYTDTTFGSRALYTCDMGYWLDGDQVRVCEASGHWSGTRPLCHAQACSSPGVPAYGSIVGDVSSFPVGQCVEYQCDRAGYTLSDSDQLCCMLDEMVITTTKPPTTATTPTTPTTTSSMPPDSFVASYRLLMRAIFSRDFSLDADCEDAYAAEVLDGLRATTPQLEYACSAVGLGVFDLTMEKESAVVQGQQIVVQTAILVSTPKPASRKNIDQCGQTLVSAIPTSIDSYPQLLKLTGTETCPWISTDSSRVTIESPDWYCPAGYSRSYLPDEDYYICIKDTIGNRRRRDTDTSKTPSWSGPVPQCQDTTLPVFTGCPVEDIMIDFDASGPVTVNLTLPIAQDNSGVEPVITVDPSEVKHEYTFTKDLRVTITAEDQAGNIKICSFWVRVRDLTPPTITCPSDLVELSFVTTSTHAYVYYPDNLVSAWDYSTISGIEYHPPNGTYLRLMEKQVVTVVAYDAFDNSAQCEFLLKPQPSGCPEWSLEMPTNGQRSCSDPIAGIEASGYLCEIVCPNFYDFIDDGVNIYSCVFGGTWVPHNFVLDCARQIFPDYEIHLSWTFTTMDDTCITSIINELNTALTALLTTSPCESTAFFFQIRLKGIDYNTDDPSQVIITAHIFIEVVEITGLQTEMISRCAGKVVEMIGKQSYFTNVPSTCITGPDPDPVNAGNFVCEPGHILKANFESNFCLACLRGMYTADQKQCVSCAQGTYQDKEGQAQCKRCPTGKSTEDIHSQSYTDCLDICPPGEFSSTTVVPCQRCAKGSYQENSGSSSCLNCIGGSTTAGTGATSAADCREICPAGHFSADGLFVCDVCPLHTYQELTGQTMCHQCPPEKVTRNMGSTQADQCIVVDQCLTNACKNQAACVDRSRFYECVCLPGFTGDRCEVNIDDCLNDPCVNNATCHDQVNNFTCECQPGSEGRLCERETDECAVSPCIHGLCVDEHLSYSCICYDGYDGDACESEINECDPDPCAHGTCQDRLNAFFCNCSDTGYRGDSCNEEIDECFHNPCQNGANCSDLINAVNCTCLPGYMGELCEHEINECDDDPCQNSGLCVDQVNGYRCICQPGYEGDDCGMDIDECLFMPCYNNATCTDRVNNYTCSCPKGFSGRHCEINPNDCDGNSCNANGTFNCQDGLEEYYCNCKAGWSGTFCETDVDDCASDPCQHNATCLDLVSDYKCVCIPGYTGKDCEVDIDNCAINPCLNGARCLDLVNGFQCDCALGWTGNACDENIDDCKVDPCQNGGICVDLIGSYKCNCIAGYAGDTCEKDIDECLSVPCQNGGNCTDSVNNYTCDCLAGYSGFNCETDINECAINPCENNGTCTDMVNGFRCKCLDEYEGDRCQNVIDDCLLNNTCKNGGTCVDGWRSTACICPSEYAQPDCAKSKSANFDLLFRGSNNGLSQPPDFSPGNTTNISICLWVRFAGNPGRGAFLTLIETGSPLLSAVITLANDVATISTSAGQYTAPWGVADSRWHHVCVILNGDEVKGYVDGGLVFDQVFSSNIGFISDADTVWRMSLGQDGLDIGGDQFFGELSQVALYSYSIDEPLIRTMANSCSPGMYLGDLKSWLEFDTPISGDVVKIEPGICGSSDCPAGYRGSFCDISIDMIAPEVAFCPADVRVINNANRLSKVEWQEPQFTDNEAITNIKQSHRSGETFAYGEYEISYVAFDYEGNIATCNFKVFVLPYDCSEPAAPVHGMSSCGSWTHGIYCRIECMDRPNFNFPALPPPFYTCGALGTWEPSEPSDPQPFKFPACCAVSASSSQVKGLMEFVKADSICSAAEKERIKDHFIQVMRSIDKTFTLCESVCTYEGVTVECSDVARKRKRATGSTPNTMTVEFDIPNITPDADKIIRHEIKVGAFNNDALGTKVKQETIVLQMEQRCEDGQVSADNNTCVNCAPGTYNNNDSATCTVCPVGEFSTVEAATACEPCPPGQTTRGTGTDSVTECYKICPVGEYYHTAMTACEPCMMGYYQDRSGQMSCKACRNGITTATIGASDVSQCNVQCGAGEELGTTGRCEKCERGSYKNGTSTYGCQRCPRGVTTPTAGATSPDQCSLTFCSPGYYRDLADLTCKTCPLGSYQPDSEKTQCEPCPSGRTTTAPGATTAKLCVLAETCETGADNCGIDAVCVNENRGYRCECKPGFHGNGYDCTDLCLDYCDNGGTCEVGANGTLTCRCPPNFTGDKCQSSEALSGGLKPEMIGGIVGGSLAALLLVVVVIGVVVWCKKRKTPGKMANLRAAEYATSKTAKHKHDITHAYDDMHGYDNIAFNDPLHRVSQNEMMSRDSVTSGSHVYDTTDLGELKSSRF